MPSFRSRAGRLLLLLSLAVAIARPSGGAPLSYAERVREETLGNGLKLILLEDHKAPVVVFQLWYRVGSRNETAGKTGLSHLLEHMMFKGTESVGPEEYSRIIQRNGGQTNAFTSQDSTTYFATLVNDRVDVVIGLEADRMANLQLSAEEYAPERAVVAEERRLRVENNPVGALFEQLGAAAYVTHPYGNPIIGWLTDIVQSTVEDLEDHYRTYYRPNNAFIVAVGGFDSDALVEQIRKTFGSIPRGPMVPAVRSLEPTQRGGRRIELRKEAELPFVALGHHVPNLRSKDGAALEVLAEVLAGGESTRLHRRLVYEDRLARQAGASYDFTSIDPGLFLLYAQPLPGRSNTEVEEALLAEVDGLIASPPTDRELQKARNAVEAGFVFAQDSLFYQGMLLGRYEVAGDWRLIDEYVPAVRRVTAGDVVRVAGFYLRAENRTTATLVPAAVPRAGGGIDGTISVGPIGR